MSSHYRKHAAVIKSLLFVCLFGSGGDLEAQTGVQTPAAPTKSEDTSDDSEPKVQNYQLKHAKAAEVLKIWKQLHGIVNGVSVDERTNSIVYFSNDEAARELRESLNLLDSETPSPIVPPTPVVQGSSQQAPVPAKSKPAGAFRKFAFKHAKVVDVVKILREVTGVSIDNENMEGFAVDERTNSVIWKVKDEWESRHWEETLLTLDGESSASKPQKTPSPYRPTDDDRAEGSSLSFQTLTISMEFDPSSTVESLKQRYNELEQQAHQLADKLRQSKSPRESERSELHAAVRKSFEARQALQRAELADLAGRMKSMQQSIDMRDKLADKVVQRRVEDLLNPNLKWDTTPSKEPKSLVADEPQNSDSTSPSLSSTQAAVARLLARLPHFATPQGDVATAPIAFLGIDYQGPWSVGDFRYELQEEIEAQISQSSSCSVVSRRMTEYAMAEQQIKPTDVVTPVVLKKLTQSLRSLDIKVQGLMIARLKHLGDSDSTRNGEFEVSLELFDINLHNYNERATVRNDRSSSDSREKEPQLLQGRWIIESWSKESEDQLSIAENQFELRIEGYAIHVFDDVGNQYASMMLDERNIEPAAYKGIACPVNYVIDPNGDRIVCPGILELDGERLRICYSRDSIEGAGSEKFRPSLFIPGSKVTLIECRRAPADTANASALNDIDLSTPQAALDTIHRYSIARPGDFPAECYIDEALLELSGMMLQNLYMMSAMSQIALQTGGVIGENDGVPVVSGASPAFHIQVDALLKEHRLPTPLESANKALELLAKLTFGSTLGNGASLVHADRQLIRMAAGVLKSPKVFLPAASKLLTAFGENDADVTKSKEAAQTQPKADITINGDEATATFISSGNDSSSSPLTAPRVTKLRRIDGRWLICEILTDEEISQMQSSYSGVMEVFGGATEVNSNEPKTSDSVQRKSSASPVGSSKTQQSEWHDFLQLLPESGTALVMFSYESETKEQMLPVAKKVAEAAAVQFIELPLTNWRKIISPEATHFVLMKDRQLVGTRTGLMTEARLRDFVVKSHDWLTPRSTGIDENSLVRIDCFINPGTDNIGSQHGGAYPMTTAVVAVHEDQALLFGPESIAEYIEKGYACVAIVRDASGNQKQVPMDVLLKGPVKLLGRSEKQPKSAASIKVTLGDGTVSEVPLPSFARIYPKSVTELLEAYDVGSAIYHIRGVQGLKPVRLAAIQDAPNVSQRVLSGSFTRERHVPPLHGFRSPIHWQSQTVPKADGHIYGDNINGAEMFEVLCPTRPAPCGFTFNEHGCLVGKYGLGEPSEKDMTHTVFKPDTTHSVLQAALEKIDDAGLKAALTQTLEESKSAASIKDENKPAAGDAPSTNASQTSSSSPARFDTPQALLARLDECSKNGSYEEFVTLFTDEGVRDLAGCLLVSAMQMTAMVDLAKQTGGNLSHGTAPISEALEHWLKPNPTQEQQQAASDALSMMFSLAFSGTSPDITAITGYTDAIRKIAERITDHRKFSVDMLNAYYRLTGEPFAYFGAKNSQWQVTQSGETALATLIIHTTPTTEAAGIASVASEHSSSFTDAAQTPVMILKNANGTWRIASLFNELLKEAEATAPVSSTPAAEVLQLLQGE